MSRPPVSTIRGALRQTAVFVRHVARNYRLFYPTVALAVLVLILDYAATSLMIPLSSGRTASSNPIVQLWRDLATSAGLPDTTQTWLWLFFLVMIARLLCGFLQAVATTYLGKAVHHRLGSQIFAQITQNEPLQGIHARTPGYYITLAGDDTFRCGTIVTSLVQSSVAFFGTLVALAVLYQFSPPLFVAVAVFLAISVVAVTLLFGRMLRLNATSAQASRELNTSFIEALNGVRSIRALGAGAFVGREYARELRAYIRKLFQIEVIKFATKALPAILLLVVAAILVRPGSPLGLPEATLFAGTIIVVKIFASLGQLVTSGSLLLTDIRAVGDIDELLGRSTEAAAPTVPHDHRASLGRVQAVKLRAVSFAYDQRLRVLDGVNLDFRVGRFYAVVGHSGSGKSTLADVVLGLVAPDRGSVEIQREQGESSSGGCILVEQHTKLFSGSVRENLEFGLDCTEDELWTALREVDLERTVNELRDGLETRINYQGDNFSGGQRQRIGIARALLRHPDVLVMDEATSALDSQTSAVVIRNVRRRMGDGILIVITHDSSIAAEADVVLDFRRDGSGNEIGVAEKAAANG